MSPGDLIIFALPLLLLFWIVSRSRKQQREATETQAAAQPGRRVMMTSGVYGEIVSVDEDGYGANTVVVELAPGVRTTWARQAIARVLPVESDQAADQIEDDDAYIDDDVPGDDVSSTDVRNSEQDTRPDHR